MLTTAHILNTIIILNLTISPEIVAEMKLAEVKMYEPTPSLIHFDSAFQFDSDPSTGEMFQHVPIRKGEKAPYEGILMKGRRYATLKLAELRMTISGMRLAETRAAYADLEKAAAECRKELIQRCPEPQCPSSPSWYETGEFWGGTTIGIFLGFIVGVIVGDAG